MAGLRLSRRGKRKSSVGDDLLSQGLAPQLPSARKGLTARFGMGLGVPPSLWSPTELLIRRAGVKVRAGLAPNN